MNFDDHIPGARRDHTPDMWWQAVIKLEDAWALIEMRADSLTDLKLKLRRLIGSNVRISNVERI